MDLKTYLKFSDVFEEDVLELFEIETALAARKATGAPSPDNVKAQIERWEKLLK